MLNLKQLLAKNEPGTKRPQPQGWAALPNTSQCLMPTKSKLLRVTNGAVLDMAVDICKSSPTLGRSVGEELIKTKNQQRWMPPGFAHGLLVLSETADFLHKTTHYYAASHKRCIDGNDLEVGINWLELDISLQLSQKDAVGISLNHIAVFP